MQEPEDDYASLKKRTDIYRIIADPDTTEAQLDAVLNVLRKPMVEESEQKQD